MLKSILSLTVKPGQDQDPHGSASLIGSVGSGPGFGFIGVNAVSGSVLETLRIQNSGIKFFLFCLLEDLV
jgi:hypothetical protein